MQTPEEAWDKIFEINVKAAFLLAKEAMPHLRETQGCVAALLHLPRVSSASPASPSLFLRSNVLFVSSIAGYTPLSNLGPYSVSKTALLGLTKVR